jgi:malate synthase
MTSHFLRCYSQLLIKTCHRREVHAMGGMAAQIPIKNDPKANDEAMARVRADKKREAADGHDGTWVAHPGLVPIAKAEFDAVMPGSNQIARKRQDVHVTAADLILVPTGPKTEAGLRQNVAIGIGYIEAWLRGIGCVPLFNLMEDAATAEISRAQIWQWVRHNQKLDDGRSITKELVYQIVREETDKLKTQTAPEAHARSRYDDAAQLMTDLVEQRRFAEFLTLPAYECILASERARD